VIFYSLDIIDWNNHKEYADGLVLSLYEKSTSCTKKQYIGDPIADSLAIVSRRNSSIIALADGVSWGSKSRLAATCGIYGSVTYLDEHLPFCRNTRDVFKHILKAFERAQQTIVSEQGTMTTLCVGVVVPLHEKGKHGLCVVNVGDSYAYIFNEQYGVKEVTEGSHPIDDVRDMRHSGGALGPADGYNPDLSNLTCSFVTLEQGDLVFVCSDGVSDNFDPVVGKFPANIDRGDEVVSLSSIEVSYDNESVTQRQPIPIEHSNSGVFYNEQTPLPPKVVEVVADSRLCIDCRNPQPTINEKDVLLYGNSTLEKRINRNSPDSHFVQAKNKRNSPDQTLIEAKNQRNSPDPILIEAKSNEWNIPTPPFNGKFEERRPSKIQALFPNLLNYPNTKTKSPSPESGNSGSEGSSDEKEMNEDRYTDNTYCRKCGNLVNTDYRRESSLLSEYVVDRRSSLLDYNDETLGVPTKKLSESVSMDNIKQNGGVRKTPDPEDQRLKSNSFTHAGESNNMLGVKLEKDAQMAKLQNASSRGKLTSQPSIDELTGRKLKDVVALNKNLTPRERHEGALLRIERVIHLQNVFLFYSLSYNQNQSVASI